MKDSMYDHIHQQITYWNHYLKRHPDSEIEPEIMDGLRLLKEIIR